MKIWICTDMEGLSGVDHWDQCYHPDDSSSVYRYGLEQLTADVNTAVAGCFDAGADTVCVLDGHGRNHNKGFIEDKLDSRIERVWFSSYSPIRFEELDESVDAVAMIGQHSMAGTLNGFIDHTQVPKEVFRYKINGIEYGEMGQFALYSGAFGVPLVYMSGDEALCAEAGRQFPHVISTPTKRGTGWATCELYPVEEVRNNIRRDITQAIKQIDKSRAWAVEPPIEIEVEWSWSERADYLARFANVRRLDARTVAWTIHDPRDIFTWPSSTWHP